MIKIEGLNKVVRFENVSEGQYFIHYDVIYLKTKLVLTEDGEDINAVDINTGDYAYFDPCKTMVKLLKGKYIVDFN